VTERRYDQSALATNFRHTLPHRDVSIELHREHGSLTTVPLPDPHASSLIWVGAPAEISQLTRSCDAGFIAALGERLGDLLGTVSDPGAKAAFPVAGLSADRLAARRTALLGEAAHILPPIGAQGLNLGFRDAGALADCVADALAQGQDPGGTETLQPMPRPQARHRNPRSASISSEPLASDSLRPCKRHAAFCCTGSTRLRRLGARSCGSV
jgi:2-octaprenyl-6-methoxyphenol hydroxylase